ncbi:MAG: Jag N-terminal domain-containing protein [Proteobacteria bacterium]|nr:RNA-binding protein [Desulfocapsa sp.]MBU3944512.1 Jag N-terminal domain-containing protein [Pseudomonadota bacterium]MCG2744099.1 Jag N-terminal domain-containing protein [Desulfobacteraceae bacterium]MBU4028101.1 Jag N-terminal domain-containing protein [Pseudomonadota bacterium]MBU4043151.1 Jag N-terminal domain-containing protein [Pseudomonadota bacterium]
MALEKKDFIGKTVADVIKQACDAFQTPQENLDIEVIETGSTGIFGFIRKKAHIRASLKEAVVATKSKAKKSPVIEQPLPAQQEAAAENPVPPETTLPQAEAIESDVASGEDDEDDLAVPSNSEEPLSQESIECVQQELTQLLQLMGFPSKIEVEAQGSSVRCHVSGDFEEDLTGQEGKTLDSLQYLLRKIIARKVSERVRISIDVGDFREKRQDELQDQALALAVLVKEDGKTQVIPSLNPSERRAVHMALQNDKEIRSRSVGDGLFKKILIYKPGEPKSGGNNRKRPQSRGRRGKGNKPTTDNGEQE